MTKTLPACFLVCCFLSCTFTTTTINTGPLFVNQNLVESNIRAVQPAENIELSIQTRNNRDSMLIVKLTVDPKIPNDSLNAAKAKLILTSFLTVLPNRDLISLSSCKIIFIKKEAGAVSTTREIGFICPITPDLTTQVANYKDSARVAIGYMDPQWTYVNPELKISLPLKAGWFYSSEENDSLVYYAIGTDINELPQYRTDTGRKVSFTTLRKLTPGDAYPVLQLVRNNSFFPVKSGGKIAYRGPAIYARLILNNFDSEDEYLQNLYELYFSKKLPKDEIHFYPFGNANFRGHQFEHADKNGKSIYYLSLLKRFRKVSLVLNLQYSNKYELEGIKQELSDLKINE
jgi:hypothetical protein